MIFICRTCKYLSKKNKKLYCEKTGKEVYLDKLCSAYEKTKLGDKIQWEKKNNDTII